MSVTKETRVLSPSFSEGKKKRRFLSAEKKYQIFLESQSGKTPTGEILRRKEFYSTDLVGFVTMQKRVPLN